MQNRLSREDIEKQGLPLSIYEGIQEYIKEHNELKDLERADEKRRASIKAGWARAQKRYEESGRPEFVAEMEKARKEMEAGK